MQGGPIRETILLLRHNYWHTLLVLHVMRLYCPPLFQAHADRAPARSVVLALAEAPIFSVALRWSLSWRRRVPSSLIQDLKLPQISLFQEDIIINSGKLT